MQGQGEDGLGCPGQEAQRVAEQGCEPAATTPVRDSLKLQGSWSSVGGRGVLGWETPGCPCAKALPSYLSLGSLPHTPELTVPSAHGLFILPSEVRVTVLWHLAPEAWLGVEEALAQMLLMVWPSRSQNCEVNYASTDPKP